ncbi:MAG: hypothetical protein K0R17_3163 [Rariglobus sp.]|jgi:hypothetical protein|nr:hypothetical protein [Rariglobus sp.]
MKSFLLGMVLAGVALISTGCVSTKNVAVPRGDASRLAEARLAVSSRPMPDFADFKASNAMFGAAGGISSVFSGNDLVRKNQVPDPAVNMADPLVAHCIETFKLQSVVTSTRHQVDGTGVEKIAEPFAGQADLLLDVQTVNWMCIYLPLNWARYRVQYSVKVRLIDVSARKKIAEGFFVWQTPKDNALSYDELFNNGAAGFKDQLNQAVAEAITHFKANVLVAR